ncbi:MAG TPA: branched-chain amino acid ABC transporter ATP-binding protein/permease [Acidimicrobiia bacterium]|nr:branched-chain amino acid ABC transporter ATP-binding protein/permease [Acidimicrobiia bacterium]
MRHKGWLALVGIAVAVVALPAIRHSTDFPMFYLIFLSGILFWTAQSTSWNILSGYSGYFSFGQGAFFGVGVYTMAVLFGRQGINWWVAALAAGLAAMLLGLAIGTIAFRLRSLRGEIFALLTLAIPFILASLARLSKAIDGGQGIVIPVPEAPSFLSQFQEFVFVVSGVVALFALTVAYVMQHTRYGWALFAIRDDEDVAEGLGVSTFFHKMIAIGVTGLIAGISGAVAALQLGFVSVEGTFNLDVPLFVIVMSVLGGRGHWAGPMVGAVYVYTLQNRLASGGFEGWSLIVLGALLVLVMLLAPEGLMAGFRRRPWLSAGIFIVIFLGLWLLGITSDPVTALALALGVTAVIAFIPGGGDRSTSSLVDSGEPQEHHAPVGDEPTDERAEVGRPLLVAENVVMTFGGVRALRGVSMRIHEGELVGLVGPNGSGKTTLVNLISGAFPPTSGSISLDGTGIVGARPHRVAHLGIARTYQIPRPFTSLTVRDNVAMAIMFGREPLGLDASRRAASEYLDLVGMGGRADAFPGEINLHQRQLLEMARAIATRPSLLLLDEALAGLNPVEIDNAVDVVRRIRASGVSIVLVEHLLRVVNQLATRIVVLDQGLELAEGEPAVVMRDPAVVKAYLGRQADAAGD